MDELQKQLTKALGNYYDKHPKKLEDENVIKYDSMEHLIESLGVVDKTDTTHINDGTRATGAMKGRGMSNGQNTELRSNPGAFTYKSPIIVNKAYDPANAVHRNIVHDSNAVYGAARKRIIAAVTAIEPKFYKKTAEKDNEAEEEELEPFKKCATMWRKRGGKQILKKAMMKSIPHGGVIYEPIKVPGVWYTADPFFIRSWDEAKISKYEYGFPVLWEVNPINKELPGYEIDVKKWGEESSLQKNTSTPEQTHAGFYFDPTNYGLYYPNPWWFASWDNTIDYEVVKEARNFYAQREGAGWKVIGIPANQYKQYKTDLENKLKNVNKEVGIVIPVSKDYPIEIQNQGGAGVAMDFNSVLEDIRSDIIADIGFPKRWFYGDSEGAMESSGKDRLQKMDAIKNTFEMWVPFIKLVLKYHKVIKELDDVIIKAPYEMQLTEEEKANIDNIRTQTAMMMMGAATTQEIREKLGLPALSDEELADQLPTPPSDEPEMGNNDTGQPKTQAKVEKNDAVEDYLALQRIVTKYDYNILEQWTGPSRATIGKMKNTMKQTIPVMKCDSIDKLDAVSLGNGIYKISGKVIPVQDKHYENLGYSAIRSYNELSKYYNDDTKPKEFRIGVNELDNHNSRVPMEISESEAVGKVQLTQIKEDGIYGDIIYDLNKADKILGPNNWIKDNTQKGAKIGTSVALRSIDIPIDDNKRYEMRHDIRSFVFTRTPRNDEAGGI